jgi:beta-phosphoglucomutase-like phosphatase (HAD superfamily)
VSAAPATPLGLVIFDCDGVLVDSMGIDMRELTRAIAREGASLSEREVHDAFHGMALPDIERGVKRRLGRALPDGWLDRYLADRAAAFERELTPIDGAAQAVEAVRAIGWETCVGSQGGPQKMEQTLRITGLQRLFPPERIFSATMVERGKPAPDLYLHAAAVCGFAPADCVVVEDSVTGVTAARAAEMRTLAYVDGDAARAERLAALGAEVFHDMRDLPRLLAA